MRLMWVNASSVAPISLALRFLTFRSYSYSSINRSVPEPRFDATLTTVEFPSCKHK